MKTILAFAVLCTALLAQVPALLSPAPITDLSGYLELTAAQAAQLQQVSQAHSQTIRHLWSQLEDQERKLNNLLESPAPDPLATGNLMIGIQNARRQIADKTALEAGRNLLTEAQRRKLASLEAALALRPAIDQAVMTGLIEPPAAMPMMPPLTLSKASADR